MAGRRISQSLVISALIVLAGLVSLPLRAEMVYRFEPSLELALLHDGNVLSASIEEELSDQLAILRPVLPLVGESERTIWSLTYAPDAEFYNTYSDLNRLNHRAELAFSRVFSPRSTWELGGAYLDTSDAHSEFLENDIVTIRSNRQILVANTAYAVGVSNRVDLSFRYDFRGLDYEVSSIAGSTSHVAGVVASYSTGTRSDIALDYAFQWFTYEDSGDFNTHNILGRYIFQPTPGTSLDLSAGVYLQKFLPESGASEETEDTGNGFIGGILWSRQGRRLNFEAGLDRQVQATGGVRQSTLAHSLHFRLSSSAGRRVQLALTGLARRNEPTLSDRSGYVDLLRAGFDLDFRFTRFLDAGFFVDYIVQRWEDSLQRDLDYPRAGVRIVFHTRQERP